MKKIVAAGLLSVMMLTACKKDNTVAEKTLEQQKLEFQQRQLEIEQQKLAIEKERIAYESQKKNDSIAEVNKAKATAAASKPKVITKTKTVYVNRGKRSGAESYASSSGSQGCLLYTSRCV